MLGIAIDYGQELPPPVPAEVVEITLNCRQLGFGARYRSESEPMWTYPGDEPDARRIPFTQTDTSQTLRVNAGAEWELQVLDLDGLCTNDVFRSVVDQISPLELKHLYMFCGGRGLDPRFAIAELSRLWSLESLSIDLSNAIGGRTDEPIDFQRWSTLKKLKRVAILGIGSGCGLRDCNDELQSLVTGHPELEELRLADFRDVTDPGLKEVSRLKKLRVFALEEATFLGQGGSESLYPLITDAGIAHFRSLADLRVVYLQGCDQVGDASLEALAQLPMLEVLGIDMNSRITAKGLEQLSRSSKLKFLSLYKCQQLDDAGLAAIQSIRTLLELDVEYCDRISKGALDQFKRSIPRCFVNMRRATSSWGLPPLGRRD